MDLRPIDTKTFITISQNKFTLSALLVAGLKAQKGDKIMISEDFQNIGEIYIHITKSDGATLYARRSNSKVLSFTSKAIFNKLSMLCKIKDAKYRAVGPIDNNGEIVYQIITAKPI